MQIPYSYVELFVYICRNSKNKLICVYPQKVQDECKKNSPHIRTMARLRVSAYVYRKLNATIMNVCIYSHWQNLEFPGMYTEKPLATVVQFCAFMHICTMTIFGVSVYIRRKELRSSITILRIYANSRSLEILRICTEILPQS